MEQAAIFIKDMAFTYQEIGEVLIEILEEECKPLADFLTDYEDYYLAILYSVTPYKSALNHAIMEDTPKFRKLLKITHAYALECQRSQYMETGIDIHASLKISDFLAEIFKRYHLEEGILKH